MELVQGISLSQHLTRTALSVESASGLLKRIASGLQAAHERGIVHRDMSPDNIILEDGDVSRARIIDFGIARSMNMVDATIIGSGFAGKYNYVAPEQLGLFGGTVTGRTDIYSLGLVIAQSVLGNAIDMGGTQADIIDKRREVPNLTKIDARLRPLLERMLQPDPLDRPASMAEIMAIPLATLSIQSHPERKSTAMRRTQSPSKTANPSRFALIAFAGITATCVAGFVLYLLFLDPSSIGPIIPTIPELQVVPPPTADLTQLPKPEQLSGSSEPPSPIAPVDPFRSIRDYVRGYEDGDCMLALPASIDLETARIDAYAPDIQRFNRLDDAFRTTQKREASIDGYQVSGNQCTALRFIQSLNRLPNVTPLTMQLARTRVKSGDTLEGTISPSSPQVALAMIDDKGGFRDVTSQVSKDGTERHFMLPLEGEASGRDRPFLLLAIGSKKLSRR